jgi:hypothetical protein
VPTIRITINGKRALTVGMAAERYDLKPASIRSLVSRAGIEADAELDGKPLYLVVTLDTVVRGRPGKGAPGRLRPHRAGAVDE